MRSIRSLIPAAVIALSGAAAMAAPVAAGGDPVNTTCPISKEPIDGKTVLTVGEHTVGFCCPRCVKAFERWDASRQESYVTKVLASSGASTAGEPAGQEPGKTPQRESDPYTLATCPISGQALGSMGEPVVKVIDGREVRFCCAACVKPFEAKKSEHFKKIDEQLVKQQLPYYPLETCIVMGEEPLFEDGQDIAVNHIYKNRLVRLCCKGCLRKFNKDPDAYLKKLDEAVVRKQRAEYPMDTCIVAGGKLGSMGEPAEIVVGNRLVRFCCAGCIQGFKDDAAGYVAKLDEAWKAKRGGK